VAAVLEWAGSDDEPVPASFPSSQHRVRGRRTAASPGELPPEIAAAVWREDELGSPVSAVVSTGFQQLDAELPGGGWPCHSLTEILQPQPTVAEWRLIAPAMKHVVAKGGHVVVIGPPKSPHLPGLQRVGLDECQLVWIHVEAPAERLWVTEQIIKANAAGLLIAWLPQARQEQIRRLQICAQACDGPVFLCRPAAAEYEPSAAPLRLQLRFSLDWELHVRVLKRKGPTHEGVIALPSIPGGLECIITPRLRKPSDLIVARDDRQLAPSSPHAVGSPASRPPSQRRVAAH
jgi:protein ImuA